MAKPTTKRKPPTQDAFQEAAEFGHSVGIADRAMVQLAIMGCRHAANGDIEPADTRALMVAFMDARRKARGEAKLVTPIASQQVSKLRQVLRLGAELGMGGVEMIEAVGSLRRAKLLRGASPRQFGEYNAVLAAAREALRKGRTLRGGELTKLLVKP